jgi:Bacterial SH3 domain
VRNASPLVTKAAQQADSARPADRIALGNVLAGGLLAAVVLAARLFTGSPAQPAVDGQAITATNQAVHVQIGAQPTPGAATTTGPTSTPQSSVTAAAAAGGPAHVANTDGQGVVLRASPRDDDRTPRGFTDGEAVTVLERSGSEWARVRGTNRQEGWVPTRYLGP